MRVFHLSSEYPPQQVFGLGRAVHDLAVAQAGLGAEVHVVTNSIGGKGPGGGGGRGEHSPHQFSVPAQATG